MRFYVLHSGEFVVSAPLHGAITCKPRHTEKEGKPGTYMVAFPLEFPFASFLSVGRDK